MRSGQYIIYLLLLSALLAGCSPQAKQMRQTKKYSKQNVHRQESKKADEVVVGANTLTKDDVNYKNLDEIRHRCVHVNKKGKRCGCKAKKNKKYCWWHNPRHQI
jgi:hypothetical protein